MTYAPTRIANYFLDKAAREGRALTPMQLLKLVYIAHGWNLGYFDRPLIDETVQAWRYGPVIKSLYDKLKQYGSGPITAPVQTGPFPWMVESEVDQTTSQLLDHVWQNYAGYSGIQLSAMTHLEGTPWSIAWHNQGGKNAYFAEIDDRIIRDHYKQKISEARAAS